MCIRAENVAGKKCDSITNEDARTQTQRSACLTCKTTVRVRMHQGSSLSQFMFELIVNVLDRALKNCRLGSGGLCLQTTSFVLCNTNEK